MDRNLYFLYSLLLSDVVKSYAKVYWDFDEFASPGAPMAQHRMSVFVGGGILDAQTRTDFAISISRFAPQ